MRFAALLCLFSFISFYASAQLNEQGALYFKKSEKYGRLKNTGRTLTLSGAALIAIGLITLSNVTISISNNGATTPSSNFYTGLLAFQFGNAAMATGIPLWIIGGNKQKFYFKKMEMDRISGSINGSPIRTGLTLRFCF